MTSYRILYMTEDDSPFIAYTLDFIFNICGYSCKNVPDGNVDVYYGNTHIFKDYKLSIKVDKNDVIWPELIRGDISHKDINGNIPFDIINAIGFFLRDCGNKNLSDDSYDIHDRVIFYKSYQYINNIADIPLVNIYIKFIKAIFEKIFDVKGVPLWPCGKVCAIGLSHDVDNPDKYAILKTPVYLSRLNLLNNIRFNLDKLPILGGRVLDKNPSDFWLFSEIMDLEEKLGFRSTFFFASTNIADRYASNLDVPYAIDRTKFKKLFQEIANRGFEIGLHASYNAFLDSNRLQGEKDKLEKHSTLKILGLRHHFWHIGRNIETALEHHECCEFEYDTSIAFNDELGFRRGIAFPYYPWSDSESKPIKVIQLPVFCMDGNLFYKPITKDYAFERLSTHIQIIKKYEGLGVIDWHVRTSYPKNRVYWDWGETYVRILNYLGDNSEIWVTSLENIASWIKMRESFLRHTIDNLAESGSERANRSENSEKTHLIDIFK